MSEGLSEAEQKYQDTVVKITTASIEALRGIATDEEINRIMHLNREDVRFGRLFDEDARIIVKLAWCIGLLGHVIKKSGSEMSANDLLKKLY